MDERPIICSHENQLLLDAIRNKFAAENGSEAGSFSPPKFNIPLLKPTATNSTGPAVLPSQEQVSDGRSTADATISTQTPSNLSQYILGQLQEKSTVHKSGFVIPQLNTAASNKILATESPTVSSRVWLPVLNSDNTSKSVENQDSSVVCSLTNGFQELTVSRNDLGTKTTIDLTKALSNKNSLADISTPTSSSRATIKASIELQDFDIPFIACDLKDEVTLLPAVHEHYCQPDVSNLKLQHSLVAPSSSARITCLKFERIRNLPLIDHSFKSKHKIERFRFDSKSPDDVILANFQKYRR